MQGYSTDDDSSSSSHRGTCSYAFGTMGTSCSLRLYASSLERADMVAALAVAEAERINVKYSRYARNSVLSELNRIAGNGESVHVDEETTGLLDYAFSCYIKSDKLFDITAGVLRPGMETSQPVTCLRMTPSRTFCH